METIQQQLIAAKEAELNAASACLETSYGSFQKLQRKLPIDAARVQQLMTELAQLRSQLPASQNSTTSPQWYDNSPKQGDMGDRNPN